MHKLMVVGNNSFNLLLWMTWHAHDLRCHRVKSLFIELGISSSLSSVPKGLTWNTSPACGTQQKEETCTPHIVCHHLPPWCTFRFQSSEENFSLKVSDWSSHNCICSEWIMKALQDGWAKVNVKNDKLHLWLLTTALQITSGIKKHQSQSMDPLA